MTLDHSLRALRASLLLSLGVLPACVGGDDGPKESGTDSGTPSTACTGSTPILDASGAATGFERCEDGTIHRVSAETTSAVIDLPACAGDEAYLSCTTDADCTGGPNGKCYHVDTVEMGGKVAAPDTGSGVDGCSCAYSCERDADCAAGQVCVPGGVVETGFSHSSCEVAECTTDADCASGECGISSYDDGCWYQVSLACRESTDSCRTDADCTDSVCAASDSDPTYSCRTIDCAIGRPMLVEGQARVSAPAARGDWSADLAAHIEDLEPALRQSLGAWWREVAGLEHASVGSFARFTLQLLALGAPPELLAEAQRAAADEVEHARLTYGLASLYLGEAVGPGPLSMASLAIETSAEAVLVGLIEEACVGETLGAAEARHAAGLAEDPALREVLTQIAADEERHAALAWRTLRWLLERRPELLSLAQQTFATTARRVIEAAPALTPDASSLGVLGPAARTAVHRAALDRVVGPCVAALGAWS